MDFSQLTKLLIIPAALIIFSINWSYACNESVCASVVSKCMLMGSCNCELSTCDCCKDCFFCLNILFDECCSCFGMYYALFLLISFISKSVYHIFSFI